MEKEVSSLIVHLMEQTGLIKIFGPKRIMSELRRHNVAKERIPS